VTSRERSRRRAVVAQERATRFAERAFRAAGVPDGDAADAAEAVVDADLHGVSTHGLKNLRTYISLLLDGRINPRPTIRDVGGGLSARVISADNALGYVAARHGMERAIELAREYGVGATFVRESNHYGTSAYWARLALRHHMVGFAFSNTVACMAPWGAAERLIGNNPPGWAIPSEIGSPENGPSRPAVVLDIALSVAAGNRIDQYRRRDEPIPTGWALDKDGEPTTDPAVQLNGGTFMPVGEYKGSGLALVLSAINCLLADAAFDHERLAPDGAERPGNCSHWFAAYDVAQFTPLERFGSRVRELQDTVAELPPRRGFDRVYSPGELEHRAASRYRAEGIPLDAATLEDLEWVAERTGIQFDLGQT
jgi:LDH2 family malate/lactate/ureidoglycolate dehydrogenase